MVNFIKKWLSKSDEDYAMHLPTDEKVTFLLKLGDVEVGKLICQNGIWKFSYSYDFKNNADKYNSLVGFSDVNKTYESDTLWPFFRLRIPGLKQPKIQEILEFENIDKENEVALLKRFGKKTIANPYSLFTL